VKKKTTEVKPKAKAKAKPVAKAKAKPVAKAKAKPVAKAKAKAKPPAKAKPAATPTAAANLEKVRATILDVFRMFYPGDESDAAILAIDPNGYDLDPGPFYDMLGERFGLGNDPDNNYFGGFGGTIATTIANVSKRWDGKLH
jgi:hypothetical protein